MLRKLFSLASLIVVAGTINYTYANDLLTYKIQSIVDNIKWFDNSSIEITHNNKVIYIDTYSDGPVDKADIVLYTNGNGDHYNAIALRNIVTPITKIISPPSCQTPYLKEYRLPLIGMIPEDSVFIDGVGIKAVYAYNDSKIWHKRGPFSVGYIITIDGVRIYHAGETGLIPEMKDITCDIALVPIGQQYTMNCVEDAVEAVSRVKAKVAIPIHWGGMEGTLADIDNFTKLLKDQNITCIVKDIIR